MPHDKNGQPLKAGDRVNVECVVKDVCEGEYCTTTLETVEKMPGNGQPTTINAINAKQVVKVALLLLAVLSLLFATGSAQAGDYYRPRVVFVDPAPRVLFAPRVYDPFAARQFGVYGGTTFQSYGAYGSVGAAPLPSYIPQPTTFVDVYGRVITVDQFGRVLSIR